MSAEAQLLYDSGHRRRRYQIGVEATWGLRQAFAGAMDTNVLLAPGGPLTLQEARVFTHQVTLLAPLTE